MASLNTFGSILTYAIELETQLHEYYNGLDDSDRAKAADKRRKKLERVRRENVLEITLEPIDGLSADDYAINFEDTSADSIESTAAQFYSDVAPKINVRQAQRALERCGKEHQALVTD